MFQQSRSRCRRLTVGALTTAILAAFVVPLAAVPAAAAVINDPPAIGHSVVVFPQRDFVFGIFALGANLKVEVWRGAVQVGVSDPFVNNDPAGFNLNHLGAPCWATVTPDIIPGDMVQVVNLDTGEIDRTTTANVVVTQNATAGAGTTVVMKGTAAQADGTQFPISQLDARIVASTKDPFSDGTRTIRVQPVYDTATGSAWTATFTSTKNGAPLTSADVALAVQSESRINWLGRIPGGATPRESTIYESLPAGGPTGGPAAGCSAPRASDAVTATTPAAVNIAAVQAGGNLLLSGTSFNAASGTVSLTDGVTATPLTAPVVLSPAAASTDPAVPLPGTQTWTASIPMASVAALTDGTLTASVIFTRVLTTTNADPALRDTGVVPGASRTLLKDVVAPQPPTASPAGGTYFAAQSVTLTAAVPALETVRYTIASGAAPDPTQFSTAASGPISVTASQQVKAVSFDPVGNPSTLLTNDYVIRTPSVSGAPTAVSATPGNALATVSWTAPTDTGGSPISTYRVDVFQGGVLQPTLSQDAGTATSWTIGALTNGVAYQFTVLAQNSIGPSPRSTPSTAVTPRTVPGAPTAVSATPGNAQATVSWTAPATDGGSPITGYAVTVLPVGGTSSVQSAPVGSSFVVTGLSNGQAYTFTVAATNAAGTGADSAATSPAITPKTVPGAPTGVTATAGNAQASVSWTAPVSDGSSAITGYTVQVFDASNVAGATFPALASPFVVTGLTNGTTYHFQVWANNAVGAGPNSASSNAVTPATVPDAPTGVAATAGDTTATVSWTAPLSNGGAAITVFQVWVLTGGSFVKAVNVLPGATVSAAPGSASSTVITGLTNGTTYTFQVRAFNRAGAGPLSTPSNAVVFATVPGAPTIGTASAGNVSATVRWTAPVRNGGSAIIGYNVQVINSNGLVVNTVPAGATATSLLVTGLTAGTVYHFQVWATNGVGSGVNSASSNSVTPYTTPGAPTGVAATAGNTTATVSWTAPVSDGGSPITVFQVWVLTGGSFVKAVSVLPGATVSAAPGSASTTVITGLTNGTTYTFQVRAYNRAGAGPLSTPSNAVVFATVPGAPTIGTATAGNASATVRWTAPVRDGGSAVTGYSVQVILADGTPFKTVLAGATATSLLVTGLTNGTVYHFQVWATNGVGAGVKSASSNSVTPATPPGAPVIGPASSGPVGTTTATATWTPPASNGGSAITGYRVIALQFNSAGTFVAQTVSGVQPATARAFTMTLAAGTYRFTVQALNAIGFSAQSARSNLVTSR